MILDDIFEELAIVISSIDDLENQTTENLQVVTLGFSRTAALSEGMLIINEQVSKG